MACRYQKDRLVKGPKINQCVETDCAIYFSITVYWNIGRTTDPFQCMKYMNHALHVLGMKLNHCPRLKSPPSLMDLEIKITLPEPNSHRI